MLNKFNVYKPLFLLSILASSFCLSNPLSSDLETSFYHVTHWNLDGNFGQASMGDVVINGRGEMIVSTNIGIKGFDGAHFIDYFNYDTHTNRNGIVKFAQDQIGGLWGVNQFALFSFSQNKITQYEVPIKYNTFNSLEVINDAPWVISNYHLLKLRDQQLIPVNDEIRATSVSVGKDENEILVGSKGKIYIISDEGEVLKEYYFENEATVVFSLYQSENGRIWVNSNHGIYLIDEKIRPLNILNGNYFVRNFFEDSTGKIWISTNKGIYVYDHLILKAVNVKNNQDIRARGIVEDSFGNIWFTTWGNGLYRLKQPTFDIVVQDVNPISYMQASDNTEWIGSYENLLVKNPGGITNIRVPEIINNFVSDTQEGLKGDVWVAYLNDLVRFNQKKEYKIIKEIDAFIYHFLVKDSNDILWVSTSNGLYYKDLKRDSQFNKFKLKPNEDIKTIIELWDRQLLFITNLDIYIYSENKLYKNNITAIFEANSYSSSYDVFNQTLWYYHPLKNSIIKFHDNEIHTYQLSDVVEEFVLYDLLTDKDQNLIIIGESGILRIRKDWFLQYDKNSNAEEYQNISYEILPMPSNENPECNSGHRTLAKNLQGELYFACKGALLKLKELQATQNRNFQPKVTIQSVDFDGEILGFKNKMHEYSPDTNSYHFTFVSYALNELQPLQFRYKLHGLDQLWNNFDATKEVIYVKLKPGDYSFEVQVKNSSSDWSTNDLGKMNFIVKKYFYQETSFKILLFFIVFILASILFVIYDYLRNKKLILQANKLRLLVNERTLSLKQVQKKKLEYEKLSKEVLSQEITRNTKKLTNQMEVILNQEKQIRQTQKMEVVGQLTSGIAHDFNNLLSIIFIGADVIKTSLLEQEKSSKINQQDNIKWLNRVLQTSENCKEVIGQLLHFSRNKVDEPKIINVNKALDDIVSLIKVSIPDTLQLSINLMKEKGLIKANIGQFNQIILNLIINARDACDDYGNIEINTSIAYIGSSICASCNKQVKGEFVEILIKDNGIGIAEEIQSKIFKPFFTAKENNIGSGIGLNVVDTNIHNMHGHILMESVVNIGTTFRVLIPFTNESLIKPSIRNRPPFLKCPNKDINILLVEDSASLVDLICLIFKEAKIAVDVAVDGIEGVALFAKNPQKYDLVITDNSMPRLKGLDMARKILEEYPKTKIILLTGNVTDELVNDVNDLGILKILHKPIRPNDLVEIVYKYVD